MLVGGFIIIINYAETMGSSTVPSDGFLLLDGGDFLLLDGTQFLLLG